MGLPVADLLQLEDGVVADSDVVAGVELQHQVELVAGLGAGQKQALEVAPGGLGPDLAPDGDPEPLHHLPGRAPVAPIRVFGGQRSSVALPGSLSVPQSQPTRQSRPLNLLRRRPAQRTPS